MYEDNSVEIANKICDFIHAHDCMGKYIIQDRFGTSFERNGFIKQFQAHLGFRVSFRETNKSSSVADVQVNFDNFENKQLEDESGYWNVYIFGFAFTHSSYQDFDLELVSNKIDVMKAAIEFAKGLKDLIKDEKLIQFDQTREDKLKFDKAKLVQQAQYKFERNIDNEFAYMRKDAKKSNGIALPSKDVENLEGEFFHIEGGKQWKVKISYTYRVKDSDKSMVEYVIERIK